MSRKKGPVQVGPKAEWLLHVDYGYIVTRAIWLITSVFKRQNPRMWFLIFASWLRLGTFVGGFAVAFTYASMAPDPGLLEMVVRAIALALSYIIGLAMEQGGNTTHPLFIVWTMTESACIGAFWGILIRLIVFFVS